MLLTQPQSEIFLNPSRFRVIVAGRRFGKTHLATVELLRAALSGSNKNCWYVAPTYRAAKEIAWDMLMQIIPSEYIDKKNETSLTISLLNGSVIALKGVDANPDALRGRSLDFVIMDEFADMKATAWTEVLRPSLSDREGNAMWIGTPKGRNHFYDLWTYGVDEHDGWKSFSFTTLDGGNVSAEEIEAARRDLDERTFKQEYEAKFVNYSGIIYYNFSREESVRKIFDDGTPLHIGMDFNLDPMSAVVCIRQGQDLMAIDEIVMYGSNTDEMADEIRQRYPDRQITIYPDPASRQRKTSAGGRTDLSILQNAGFAVKVRNSHPAIRDRINAVNSRLKSGEGRHLFADPKCKQTIKSLERQTYKEGTSQPNKDDGFDHMNDALGYLVEFLYPVRREYDVPQPTRWT